MFECNEIFKPPGKTQGGAGGGRGTLVILSTIKFLKNLKVEFRLEFVLDIQSKPMKPGCLPLVKRQPRVRKPVPCGQPFAGAEASESLRSERGVTRGPTDRETRSFPGGPSPTSRCREPCRAAVKGAGHLDEPPQHREAVRALTASRSAFPQHFVVWSYMPAKQGPRQRLLIVPE